MIAHDFGSNFTLQRIKETLEYGKGYVCELHQTLPFEENDCIIFDGVSHTYKEWKEFLRITTKTEEK